MTIPPPSPFPQQLADRYQADRAALRSLLLSMRQMLLGQVDAIERMLDMSPRTSELRKTEKRIVV